MIRFGMMHGPLAQMDSIGMDVVHRLFFDLATEQPRLKLDPAPLAWMISRKWLGEKAGIGFFRHAKRKSKPNWPLISHLKDEGRRRGHRPARALSAAEEKKLIQGRLVGLMLEEAAWCLREGRAADDEQLDHALTLAGWAPHRGGPFTYARERGIPIG
jgi:3-hydroxyacyl-CoA dehydrogenase/enoyl-CoA hydratase/3-hydroxybutyryl-CoA epimerase